MKYNVTLGGKVYEVEVERGEAALISVSDMAVNTPASPPPVSPPPASPAPSAQAADGERISSPLPGVVLNVKVQPGDAVKAGDTMIIIEAMKMENEIAAPRDGRVAQVSVSKGSSVNTGDTLLTLA